MNAPRLLVATALLFAALASPASADTINGYNKTASTVADKGNCKNVRGETSGGGVGIVSHAVCDLRGRKVEILTFSKKTTEARYLSRYCSALPSNWVMLGAGFVVAAVNGNRPAAKTAGRVYGGPVYRCSELMS